MNKIPQILSEKKNINIQYEKKKNFHLFINKYFIYEIINLM
jgi:hypothetical protein